MRCVYCGGKIINLKYAIRDSQNIETYWQWWWRHFKGLMTAGFLRPKLKTFLPICNECVKIINRSKENI